MEKNFILDAKIQSYFQTNGIKIIKYYDKFNMLKIESKNLLLEENIKYINYLELEQEFHPEKE